MTHEAWDVPARQAWRELEAWSHRWRGIDGGDGARLAAMLSRMLIRVTPGHKLASLRLCLATLLDAQQRARDDDDCERQVVAFVEELQGPPPRPAPPRPAPPRPEPAPARVLRPPWRCRWFGHAWRQGRAGSCVALYCERTGCLEERRWPKPPLRLRPVVSVGVAPSGALVTVTLDGKSVPAKDGTP